MVLLLSAVITSSLLAAEPLPRVHLVATGGTIVNARAGRLTAEELTASVPDVAKLARLSHEQFSTLPVPI
jgi:hypothetical protein